MCALRDKTLVRPGPTSTPHFLGIHAFFESNDEFALQSAQCSQRRQQANERKEQGSKSEQYRIACGRGSMSGARQDRRCHLRTLDERAGFTPAASERGVEPQHHMTWCAHDAWSRAHHPIGQIVDNQRETLPLGRLMINRASHLFAPLVNCSVVHQSGQSTQSGPPRHQ